MNGESTSKPAAAAMNEGDAVTSAGAVDTSSAEKTTMPTPNGPQEETMEEKKSGPCGLPAKCAIL